MLYILNPKNNTGRLTLDKLYPINIDIHKSILLNNDIPDSGSEYEKTIVRRELYGYFNYVIENSLSLFLKNMPQAWFEKFTEIMINEKYSLNLLKIAITSMFGKLLYDNILNNKFLMKASNFLETFKYGIQQSKYNHTEPINIFDYIGFSKWIKSTSRFKDTLDLMKKFKEIDEELDINKITAIWKKGD